MRQRERPASIEDKQQRHSAMEETEQIETEGGTGSRQNNRRTDRQKPQGNKVTERARKNQTGNESKEEERPVAVLEVKVWGVTV